MLGLPALPPFGVGLNKYVSFSAAQQDSQKELKRLFKLICGAVARHPVVRQVFVLSQEQRKKQQLFLVAFKRG